MANATNPVLLLRREPLDGDTPSGAEFGTFLGARRRGGGVHSTCGFDIDILLGVIRRLAVE
jgi:hypothetical protein